MFARIISLVGLFSGSEARLDQGISSTSGDLLARTHSSTTNRGSAVLEENSNIIRRRLEQPVPAGKGKDAQKSEGVWVKIKNVFTKIWDAIKNFFTMVWGGIMKLFGKGDAQTSTRRLDAAKEGVYPKSVWEHIAGFFSNVWEKIKEVATSAWTWITSLFKKEEDKKEEYA